MATATPAREFVISAELKPRLAELTFIDSASIEIEDGEVLVVVGISEDTNAARAEVYRVEDEISQRHQDLIFEFRIVPLSGGKTLTPASTAQPIFSRSAA